MDYDYSVWTPGTKVTLCNVPWDSVYRDVWYEPDENKVLDYLATRSGPSHTFTTSYAKVGEPIRVDLPFNACYQFNYLVATNGAQNVDKDMPRTFYYFVQDVRHIAANTTELTLQLDVWQTFGRHVSFGNSYVERSHLGIANDRGFDDYGREYLTVPEGFDLGNEYVVSNQYVHDIARLSGQDRFQIIMHTTVSLKSANFGTVENPVLETARGSMFGGLPHGAEMYLFPSPNDYVNFMSSMSGKPWITQGIISVQAIPPVFDPDDAGTSASFTEIDIPGVTARVYSCDGMERSAKIITLRENWRNDIAVDMRYAHLLKFKTYPYTLVELTTYSATPIILKPECMPNSGLVVGQYNHIVQPNPRVLVFPVNYNASRLTPVPTVAQLLENGGLGEFLDMTTGIFNLPAFSVVNNAYLSFMASNAHSIAYARDSADWSQQRALMGNQLSFDNTSVGMGLQTALTEMNVSAANRQTALQNQTSMQQAAVGVAGNVIGGARMGGLAGAGLGALGSAGNVANTAIQVNQNSQSTAINNALMRSTNASSVGATGQIRDANRAYADFAAKGDYANTILGINAKVQDAQLMQPTTSGQVGGDSLNLALYRWAIHGKVKTLQPAVQRAIGEYWLRYGYAINQFYRMRNLQVMTHFTYWKLRECYISSSRAPELFKQTIRGIFEKGVTVWNNPEHIGNIDIGENTPLKGVRY